MMNPETSTTPAMIAPPMTPIRPAVCSDTLATPQSQPTATAGAQQQSIRHTPRAGAGTRSVPDTLSERVARAIQRELPGLGGLRPRRWRDLDRIAALGGVQNRGD